ncbi:hypothetical protein CO666_04195 [Rhizobium chutanense]|uniref:Transmembrane protein n=1 Tax=Rhizobium chutanense TaxID=2035448 RepID=A0A2A6JIF2_9HYPH|nr:hypothetical protein CO666_04195 [Rhizobium chutanense]
MFLEDEFAVGRMRMRRISVLFLVAVTAFVACIAAIPGLASAARATETQQVSTELAALVRPNGVAIDVSGPIVKAAAVIAQKSSTVNLAQTATRADEQIARGLTMLLLALMAASGLAVWRRRLKGIVMIGTKRNGR